MLMPSHPASRASFCLFLYWGGEKEALPELRQLFEAAAARTSGLVNLVFSRQTGFSSASVSLVTKPMVIIEPAVPWKTKMAARSGILGLGSRLHPGNMQRILNKDLTRFMQSLSRERPNRASKRKALLQQVAKIVETLHLLGALLISLLSLTLQPPSPPYQCC